MHDETLYAERALRAGAQGYVMKREASKNVLTSIHRVREGGVFVSERVANRIAMKAAARRKAGATSPVERLSDRKLETFRLLRPEPHHITDCLRLEPEPENRPGLLRSCEGKIWCQVPY